MVHITRQLAVWSIAIALPAAAGQSGQCCTSRNGAQSSGIHSPWTS